MPIIGLGVLIPMLHALIYKSVQLQIILLLNPTAPLVNLNMSDLLLLLTLTWIESILYLQMEELTWLLHQTMTTLDNLHRNFIQKLPQEYLIL